MLHFPSFATMLAVSFSAFLGLAAPSSAQTNDALALYPGEGLFVAGGTATYSASDVSSHNFSGGFTPDAGASDFVAGHSGLAFHFDGTNYLALSGFTGSDLSFGFWMRDNATNASPQADNATVIENSAILNKASYFAIVYHNGYVFKTSNGAADVPFTLTPGVWHHITVSRLNLVQKLYVDGVLKGVSTGTQASNYDYDNGIRCGADSHTTAFWQGDLDDIRFYNRELSAQEISFFATGGKDALLTSKGNIYLAGQAAGTTASGGTDSAPNYGPGSAIAVQGGQTLTFAATGSFIDESGLAGVAISGDLANNATHAAENGISSITAPKGSLVGVFLDASTPSGSAPSGLDYSDAGNADLDTFRTPALRQVFYVGAGGAGGHLNPIIAPAGAMRLFLAVLDANSNSNNFGNVSVHLVADSAFNAVRDFYTATNDASQPWSYGYTATDGTGFTLYTGVASDAQKFSWTKSDSEMSVALNTTGHDITYSSYVLQQPDVLALFPGNDGRKSVVRWTAPAAGDYKVQGRFQDIDETTTDVAIVYNGDDANPTFTDSISDSTAQLTTVVKNFTLFPTVAAGDTIDFRVGDGGNGSASDGTGLAVVITPINTANPNALSIDGDIADGGAIHFVTGTTDAGVSVILQYSTTPDVEGSWKTVKDGNGVPINLNSGTYSSATGVNSYPVGSGIYFRAVSSTTGNSNVLGPYTLKHAVFTIAYALTSTSDPVAGTTTRIGDDLTYTFNWSNIGNLTATNVHVETPIPTYLDAATNITKKFPLSALTFNSFGHPNDAQTKIVWDVSDLQPTFGQSVTLKVHIGTDVRLNQQITLANDYRVYSGDSATPNTQATGFASGSANLNTTIRGPVKLTAALDPGVTTVAPGATFNYTLKLTNLSSNTQKNGAIVFDVPLNTRFVSGVFLKANTTVLKTLPPGAKAPFLVNPRGTQGEVLVPVGQLASKASQTVRLTFQAQWVNPLDPHIVTQNYVGAFIDPAAGSAAADFKKGIGSPDYYAFLTNQASQNSLFFSSNESGALSLGLAGSLANQPILGLLKALSSDVGDMTTDGATTQNLVHPGKPVTFLLALSNTGNSPAEDVYVSDLLPTHATFQSFSFLGKTSSSKKSDLEVVQDPDGRHISFRGIHLDAQDFAALQYTVIVDSGADAPAKGTVIGPDPATHYDDVTGLPVPATIGSTSTPQTQGGFYVSGPIVVTGDALLTPPHVRPVPLRPGVSSDLATTASALDAFYAVKKNAKKTLPAPNDLQPLTFAPGTAGTECYYLHYENNGDIAAKGVSLEFPLPAHTAFYRAAFVKLDKNDAKGALGNPPGTISAKPAGASISAPAALARSGTVSFQFSKLNPGDSGDVMVQVIVAPDALRPAGSVIGDVGAQAVIHDSTVPSALAQKLAHGSPRAKKPPFSGEHLASAPILVLPVDYQLAGSASAVPAVGICQNMPPVVQAGSNFQVQVIVFNNGNIDADDILEYTLPTNTTFVSAECGQSYLSAQPAVGGTGVVEIKLASNNGPIYPSGDPRSELAALHAHTAGAATITLKATGPVGSTIVSADCHVTVGNMGTIKAPPTTTPIGAVVSTARLYSGTGLILNQQTYSQGQAYLINLGANNLVASGAGNLVASGAGNLIASGAGNLVASGAGNVITINGSSALAALNNQSSLVASGAGNVAVLGNASLVASGAGNLVASGAGNIVSHDASGLVASGGGNLVASGAGNLVASGAGNLVASGAGNIVASGAGNIVTSSGQILASIPGSTASLISQDGGGIVASGAGNLVASGAGN